MSMKSNQQSGFISIFSVMIIMTILSLTVLGFSVITRRAQRQTLDNQLSTQAYYSAESGINDAVAFLNSPDKAEKTDCQGPVGATYFTSYDNDLDTNLNAGYTCVLVSLTSPIEAYDSVGVEGTASPIITTIKSSTGSAIKSFDVEWRPVSGSANIPSSSTLPPSASWVTTNNYLGMVRIDLVPDDGSADLTRDAMANKTITFFLYPDSSAATSSFNLPINNNAAQGQILNTKCTVTPCTASINLGVSNTTIGYRMRLQSIYSPTSVTIKNGLDVTGVPTNWTGGQAVIDVTGKANDVFRRIQVYKAINPSGPTAPFVLESAASICKVLLPAPAPSGTTLDTSIDTTGDESCKIN